MQWTLTRYRGTYANNARSLDINRMVKQGVIMPSGRRLGGWAWTDKETGEQLASISYESDTIDPLNSYLRIFYTLTEQEKKIDYNVRLSRSKPHYGGERFWFICPVTGRRVGKLYLPAGGDIFASRHAYRLAYACQSEGFTDRALRKKWKLLAKFDDRLDLPLRPKGMHEKTYERLLAQYEQQEEICMGYLLSMMQRL